MVADEGTVYFQNQEYLYAVNSDGSLKWRFTKRDYGTVGPLAIGSDGTIYVPSRIHLYAVNPNGTLKWKIDFESSVSAPSIGVNGILLFGVGRSFYAINPDGSLKWKYTPTGYSHFGDSPAISSDGTIYAGGDRLFAISSTGTLKWQSPSYYSAIPPTISMDSTLYFILGREILAFRINGNLANSAWPMFQHDARHTGRSGGKRRLSLLSTWEK